MFVELRFLYARNVPHLLSRYSLLRPKKLDCMPYIHRKKGSGMDFWTHFKSNLEIRTMVFLRSVIDF